MASQVGTKTGSRQGRPTGSKPMAAIVDTSRALSDKRQAHLLFMKDFQQFQQGEIAQGGEIVIEYETDRLRSCQMRKNGLPNWNLVAYVKFEPGAMLCSGSLLEPNTDPPRGRCISVPVPAWANEAQLWFNNTDGTGCSVWDSQYGANYRYPVRSSQPPPPADSVGYRTGAITSLPMVNVISGHAGTAPGDATSVSLSVLAWVNNVSFAKSVFVDIHVFDAADQRIVGRTMGLSYLQPGGGGGDFFTMDQIVYQQSGGRPTAAKVQYRLYYEVNGQVFTDGILHTLIASG